MKIKDLLRDPETHEELSLDTSILTTITTCCDREFFESRVYVEDEYLYIDYNIGTCRNLGSAMACKNLLQMQLLFKHLCGILTPEQKADILTHPEAALREILSPYLKG
jgi:hypothetical protein